MRTSFNMIALLTLAVMAGCTAGDGRRTIEANIGGGGGKTLYFDKFAGNKPVHVDSVKLDAEGKGTLHLPRMPLDFYALVASDKDMLVLVLDSAESVKVEATIGNLQAPTTVEGSVNSSLLYDFFRQSKEFDQRKQRLVQRINNDRTDSAAIDSINALNVEFYQACKKFAQDHKSSPAVLAAISRLNIQNELPLFTEVCDALKNSIPKSDYYAGFRDQVARMTQEAAAQKAQQAQMAQMDQLIPVGSDAPNFTQPTPDGKPLSLSDLRGKVVLIDFWASWCRPCRMEMPNVKQVYAKFHPQGFEVLGVSLDKTKEAWTGAIAQDQLPWKHVSDLGFWNNTAAQQYGVNSIPYTVLVGKDGKVIAKNLRGPALEAKLAEVFR